MIITQPDFIYNFNYDCKLSITYERLTINIILLT